MKFVKGEFWLYTHNIETGGKPEKVEVVSTVLESPEVGLGLALFRVVSNRVGWTCSEREAKGYAITDWSPGQRFYWFFENNNYFPPLEKVVEVTNTPTEEEPKDLGRWLSGIDKYKNAPRSPKTPFEWL